MHIFDIRRSNSVTDLWKRYDATTCGSFANEGRTQDTKSQEAVGTASVSATSAPGDDTQPLLSAFEAELANMMNATNASEARTPQPKTKPTTESSTNIDEQRIPHPAELLAAQIMQHLVGGVSILQSELSKKLPELQRQVRNAQRSLPDHVSTSLQSLLATLEAQIRTAYNNLPNGGRQMAEDAIHAGRPVAENAADSFRMVASEFNEVGRTLFTAFENEFGRLGSQDVRQEPHNAPDACTIDPGSPPIIEPATGQHTTSHKNDQGQVPIVPAPPVSQLPLHEHPLPPAYSGRTPQLQRPWASGVPPPASGYPANIHPAQPPQPHIPMYWSRPLPWGLPPPHPRPFPAPGAQGRHVVHPLSPEYAAEGTHTQFDDSERKTLFIGNVGFKVTECMIRDVFASKGFVVDVVLPLDEPSSEHAGFGYLHFPSIHPALAALDVLQGAHIDGHAINLEFCDVAPVESLRSSRKTSAPTTKKAGGTHVPEHRASGSEAVVPGEAISSLNPKSSRRKSVTFQEPPLPPKEAIVVGSESNNQDEQFVSTRADSPPLIDLMADETASTTHPTPQDGHDALLDLNSELEMSRFPPVSQLEAQHLTRQRSIHSTHRSNTTPEVNKHLSCQDPSLKSAREPIRSSRSLSNMRDSQGLAEAQGAPSQTLHHIKKSERDSMLHRSNTLAFASPRERHAGTPLFGEPRDGRLRRRATERASLRPNARSATEADTWARLDRRERNRLSSVSHETLAGGFTVEENSQPDRVGADTEEAYDANIRTCVSSLIDMGYGTVHDGGRSRMAVYAAASNGSLLDAIDMIEEERKAYARHDQQ